MDKIARLQELIEQSQNIVFFGGAGVSTESNIPDFRSSDGIYSVKLGRHFTAEQLVSHTMFERYPQEFFDFYKKYLLYPDAKPNAAHAYLADLEKAGKLKAVVTQNIDSLHEMAGSKKVLKLHGSADRNYCLNCQRFYDLAGFLALKGTVIHRKSKRTSRLRQLSYPLKYDKKFKCFLTWIMNDNPRFIFRMSYV